MRKKQQFKRESEAKVTVLLSGGIDSSACVAFYLEQCYVVNGTFIDYGQAAAKRESRSSSAIANHYNIPLTKLSIKGVQQKGAGIITGRNAFLIFSAIMEMPIDTSILAIGVHAGTGYTDCSPRFIRKMQSLIDMYTFGVVQIGAPFLRWTKGKIWEFCRLSGLPTKLTYSCEYGVKQPCGRCRSCLDLEALGATI